MQIGIPYVVEQHKIMEMAIYFHTTYDKVEEILSQVWIINEGESIRLKNSIDENLLIEIGGSYIFGDILYINNAGVPRHLYYFVSYKLFGIKGWTEPYASMIMKQVQDVSQLDSVYRSLISRIQDISCMEKEIYSGFRVPDYTNFKSACRKYKIPMQEVGNIYELTFKNVKVGNDIEGFIQYKKIMVYWDKVQSQIKSIHFHFNNFVIKSEWGLYTPHPHMSVSDVEVGNDSYILLCIGNRKKDFDLYVSASEWGFLLQLMKEQMTSYNPGDAFKSVGTVRTAIQKIEKALPEDISKLERLQSNEMMSCLFYQKIIGLMRYCHICGTKYRYGSTICRNAGNHPQITGTPSIDMLETFMTELLDQTTEANNQPATSTTGTGVDANFILNT